jgi:hypothetical protein
MVWLARHPRDYGLSIALVHIDVSSTPVPRAAGPDRQIALVSIVYHCLTFLIFMTLSVFCRRWLQMIGHPLLRDVLTAD